MDKIDKALNKLSQKERDKVKIIINKLINNDFNNLDVCKLKNRSDIYRIKSGRIRIIYYLKNNNINILVIERRNDTTYNF